MLEHASMSPRWISAILWTLVSVNALTIIFGGLTTWLGYAIPVRLKQFGLLPELAIASGFASLLVACLGLCALNYSSHNALNIYGFFCSLFVLMFIFGLPENWFTLGDPLASTGSLTSTSVMALVNSTTRPTTNSSNSAHNYHIVNGSILLKVIYFSLLFILLVVLSFAFVFAFYLRRKEVRENLHAQLQADDCELSNCACKLYEDKQPQRQQTFYNNHYQGSSIRDPWLPWATQLEQPNVDQSLLLQPPSLHPHIRDNKSQTMYAASTSGLEPQYQQATCYSTRDDLSCAPLIHKGFYHTFDARDTSLDRGDLMEDSLKARSLSHPLSNGLQEDEEDENEEETALARIENGISDDEANLEDPHNNEELTSSPGRHSYSRHVDSTLRNRICKSSSNHRLDVKVVASKDDSSVQYGRDTHYKQHSRLHNHYPIRHHHHRHQQQYRQHLHPHHHHNQQKLHHYQRPIDNQQIISGSSSTAHLLAQNPNIAMVNTQYGQSVLARCSCNLSSAGSLRAKLNASSMVGESMNIHDQYVAMKQPSQTLSHYMQPSAVNCTTRSCSKLARSAGSKSGSSVMAVTAAAAAALLGGVADASMLSGSNANDAGVDIDSGDMFGGNNEDMMASDKCEFDNNDHQFSQDMLNTNLSNSTLRYNVTCRQPVLDFTPLLEMRK